jgi:hypothetical protein
MPNNPFGVPDDLWAQRQTALTASTAVKIRQQGGAHHRPLLDVGHAQKAARPPAKRPVRPDVVLDLGKARKNRAMARTAALTASEQPIGTAALTTPPAFPVGATWGEGRHDHKWASVCPSLPMPVWWQGFAGRVLEASKWLESVTVERAPLPPGHGRTWFRASADGRHHWAVVQLPSGANETESERLMQHEFAHLVQEVGEQRKYSSWDAWQRDFHDPATTERAEAWAASQERRLRPTHDVESLITASLWFAG